MLQNSMTAFMDGSSQLYFKLVYSGCIGTNCNNFGFWRINNSSAEYKAVCI